MTGHLQWRQGTRLRAGQRTPASFARGLTHSYQVVSKSDGWQAYQHELGMFRWHDLGTPRDTAHCCQLICEQHDAEEIATP